MAGNGKITVGIIDGKVTGPVLFECDAGVARGQLKSSPAATARVREASLGLIEDEVHSRPWFCYGCRKPAQGLEATDLQVDADEGTLTIIMTCGKDKCAAMAKETLARASAAAQGMPAAKDGKRPVLTLVRIFSSLPAEDCSSGPAVGDQLPEKEVLVPANLMERGEIEAVMEILGRTAQPAVETLFGRQPRTCLMCGTAAASSSIMQHIRPEQYPWVFVVDAYPRCDACAIAVKDRFNAWYRHESKGMARRFARTCVACSKSTTDPKRDFQRCSRCGSAYYCSRECQRQDWPHHKAACRPKDAA
ncbi:hypothetical protein DFJ74DRAFT_686262 [Hyaloraphidium curvatum]|nr:hypothetical protein DFJ74DRAFT_686262 [Hyaloraphidium curvatum]